jgi:pimeloyl-ACP methyl ester carboxylesterase
MRSTSISCVIVVLFFAHAAFADYAKLSTDLTLYYEASGHGTTTVVFIPGWTMSSDVFARQLAYFADSDRFRAIAYDPRGQGRSSKTLDGHTYQQHGRDLAALIEHLALDDIVLVGWSSGANDEMAYVNQFGTDRLRALVLLDGTARATGDDNSKEWVWYRRDDRDRARGQFTVPLLEDRETASLAFATWMLEAATPENIRWVVDISRQTPDSIAALTNETGAYVDYESDLVALEGKVPMLFVVRDEWRDVVTAWRDAHTPSAEVAAFGRHLMFWERSREFNAVLARFLESIPARE